MSNASGEEIPAFAAMRVTGVGTDGIFTVAKPNTNDQTARIFFNGPVKIPIGEKGNGTPSLPCKALYDTGDGTPSAGDEWGVENGGWKLRNARSGFLITGGVNSSGGHAVVELSRTASGTLTVREEDGSPSVSTSTLRFPNTSLIDNGGGSVSVREADFENAGLVADDDQALGFGSKYVVGNATIGCKEVDMSGVPTDGEIFLQYDNTVGNESGWIGAGIPGGLRSVLLTLYPDGTVTGDPDNFGNIRINAGMNFRVGNPFGAGDEYAIHDTDLGGLRVARGLILGFNADPGDILYVDAGGDLVRLPIGTPGQVLTVDAGGLPVWA